MFLSPEVPEGQKGTKLNFSTLLILNAKLSYLIAIQYVSLRLLLKIINLYKIS